MAEIVHMRGLLARMECLKYLGAVSSDAWSAVVGYKYSMPLEIRIGSVDMQAEKRTVRWKKGETLERALGRLRGRACKAAWVELKDDQGAVYFSKKLSLREHIPYLVDSDERLLKSEPKVVLADLSALQREIEGNPKSERSLNLYCRYLTDWELGGFGELDEWSREKV